MFRKFETWARGGAILGGIGLFVTGVVGDSPSLWSIAIVIAGVFIGVLVDPDMTEAPSNNYSKPKKKFDNDKFEEYQFYKHINK